MVRKFPWEILIKIEATGTAKTLLIIFYSSQDNIPERKDFKVLVQLSFICNTKWPEIC